MIGNAYIQGGTYIHGMVENFDITYTSRNTRTCLYKDTAYIRRWGPSRPYSHIQQKQLNWIIRRKPWSQEIPGRKTPAVKLMDKN